MTRRKADDLDDPPEHGSTSGPPPANPYTPTDAGTLQPLQRKGSSHATTVAALIDLSIFDYFATRVINARGVSSIRHTEAASKPAALWSGWEPRTGSGALRFSFPPR
jgi:hypothetical protein